MRACFLTKAFAGFTLLGKFYSKPKLAEHYMPKAQFRSHVCVRRLRFRRIDINKDRDFLLEFHCRINYESETPYMRKSSYEKYRNKWLRTSQPESFLSDLEKTMEENRTIAEILEDDKGKVGYLWVTLTDIQDYSMTVAGIMDIAVAPDYQREGIGTMMLEHIEELAKEKGAALIRSDTGIENIASQRLHEKFGFKPYRIHYEKAL
jgi:ribosomal protein S18 acetylase RimI-like enzyme